MEKISGIFGFLAAISIFGIAVSGVVLLLRAVMKKSVKVNMIILASFLGLLVLSTIIGTFAYSNTDDYKKHLADKEQQMQVETQSNKTLENELASTEVPILDEANNKEAESESATIEKINIESEKIENIEETIQSAESESESNNEILEDAFLTSLKSNLDKKVSEKAYDILKNQIGFSNLEYKGKMEGLTNYEIKADGYDIVLTASDDVYRIFIPSSSYVFYEDGEVKLTYEELESKTIDQHDRNIYYIMAEDIVRSSLKNPDSAKFPSIVTHSGDITMQRSGNIVAVQSYVDAKNDFGAKIRNNWVVEFEVVDMDTYSYNLIYTNIGGQEYGEFIELE